MTRVSPGMKITARSASDKTDDWFFWILWNGTVNVTAEVLDALNVPRKPGQIFLTRGEALEYAEEYRYWVNRIHLYQI